MLFQLNAKGDAVLHPEAVDIIAELKKVSKKDLLFIIYAFDYYSPFHQFPEEERIRKAGRKVYDIDNYDLMSAPDTLHKAIEMYRSLQYDTRRELMISYQTKIAQVQIKLRDETVNKKILEMDELMTTLLKGVKQMQEDINHTEQMEEIRGGGQISYIEKWQLNRKQYLEDQARKQEIKDLDQRLRVEEEIDKEV